MTRAIGLGLLAAALLGAAFFSAWVPRQRARAALEADARSATPGLLRVEVVAPKVLTTDRALNLPGSVRALEETVVYSRASGYVRRWHKDIGDRVAEGDLLAEIDTPELDQQIAQGRARGLQAEAGVVQAKANGEYSRLQLRRQEQLNAEGLVSKQELEKQRAQSVVDESAVAVAAANVEAQRADNQRLAQLKSFARVTAPFAGIVTARTVERGALVTAGTANPLFRLAATDPVRVFVQVPQDVAPSVRVGAKATVAVREFAGRPFPGEIARAAGALDAATRTMTVEVRVPNPKGEILTGMYAQVALSLPTPHRVLELPGTVLFNDAAGLRVAAVVADGRVHLVPVVLERDTGATVEIASGLAGDERVVRLATPELTEGRAVDVR